MLDLVFVLVLVRYTSGDIYYLNDTEYDRMPVKYYLDNYNKCLKHTDGRYCTVNFDLVTDSTSDLLNMIQEYSKVTTKHYNHTKLRYGLCLSESCPNADNITLDPESILEGCLNDSLWKNYELKAKVTHYNCYTSKDVTSDINTEDIIVAAVIALILLLNFVGSIYESYAGKKKGKSLLLCFSISRNWKQLTLSRHTLEPRLQRLRGLSCIKCIILAGVILAHCIWPFLLITENIHNIEMIYSDLSMYIIINGPLMIQTYLVVSGFLLVYKLQMFSEKNTLSWSVVPKGILLRYLRITPTWAVVIALSATWLKFAGPGPFWDVSGGAELSDCRTRWWVSLLYFNNYIYDARCLMHTWYFAVDMQLYSLGLILCVILRNPGQRRKVLISLFAVGLVIIAAHTYFQDFNAILIVNPEDTSELFVRDPTYNEVYKRGHTNIPSYVIGMALGYLIYKWQDVDIQKYKKYRVLYWLLVPMTILVLLSGRMFYGDAPRASVYIRTLYGVVSKPVIGLLAAAIIAGAVLKLEGTYRGVMEWRGWTIPGRLSFCAFTAHFSMLTLYVASQTTLKTLGPYDMYVLFIWVLMVSYLTAVPLWLLVEAPFTEITKYFMYSPQDALEKNEAYSANL